MTLKAVSLNVTKRGKISSEAEFLLRSQQSLRNPQIFRNPALMTVSTEARS